jgi:hypothetical protein
VITAETSAAAHRQLPTRFFGSWERRELTIDGVPSSETSGRAIWIQAGDAFVDVRGPGGVASDTCFAGTAVWEEPYLTWTHEIDRHPSAAGVDRGHITFDGNELVETGDFIGGAHHSYQERWCPARGPRTPVVAAVARDGIAVRFGDHAAVVVDRRVEGGGFAASYSRLTDGAWRVELMVTEGAGAPLIAPLGTGELSDGWRWHTVSTMPDAPDRT